jgi:hypothetical protein
MTRRDVASDLPISKEECESLQGGSPRPPPAIGPAVAKFKTDLQLKSNDAV